MFHLAIPSKDIQESVEFYQKLGCEIGRTGEQFAIINLFDHQVVCHLSTFYDRNPTMYPRHYGIILSNEKKFLDLWSRWQFAEFIFEEHFVRFKGKREEHHTFFLKDPSNNLIEFKWYKNAETIFGK